MGKIAQCFVVSGLIASTVLGGEAEPRSSPKTPFRVAQGLTACFCPSTHANVVISSRAELESMIASAPCTSRGEGAEERAKAWGDRCRRAIAQSGLSFERDALVYVARFFPSGMITGSLEVSGPDNGVLNVAIRRHQPKGPLTPDLGFFQAALVVDRSRIRQILTDDGAGHAVRLQVGPATKR